MKFLKQFIANLIRSKQEAYEKKLPALDQEILIIIGWKKRYGLEIIDQLNLRRNAKQQLMFPSLYPALNRLYKMGFISFEMVTDDKILPIAGTPRRKYYEATEKGKATLLQIQQETLKNIQSH